MRTYRRYSLVAASFVMLMHCVSRADHKTLARVNTPNTQCKHNITLESGIIDNLTNRRHEFGVRI